MKDSAGYKIQKIERPKQAGVRHLDGLDLVVPFTTPRLTRTAIEAARRMGAGLNASLRLIKIQVVPFPLDLNQSPVYVDFLKEQLRELRPELPAVREVCLARELEAGLVSALSPDSVVILAASKRLWKTRNERLTASLRSAGHKVVLVFEGGQNA